MGWGQESHSKWPNDGSRVNEREISRRVGSQDIEGEIIKGCVGHWKNFGFHSDWNGVLRSYMIWVTF